MGWFDEQIKLRETKDQELFEDSILDLASVILGNDVGKKLKDERIITKETIDELLKYFHLKPVEIPETVSDGEEQLDYALRVRGLMKRDIELSEKWYKDAFGPMIGYLKENDKPVLLLPRGYKGYSFKDEHGVLHKIDKDTAKLFRTEANCFYKPLPVKPLNLADLFIYMKNMLQKSDYVFFIILTVIVVLVGTMTPRMTSILTGFVYSSGNTTLLFGTAVFVICVCLTSQMLKISKELALNKMEVKTSLAMESAIMMRIMSMPSSFFRKYNAGELNSRKTAVNSLSNFVLQGLFSAGLTSLVSLIYIKQIFNYAPGLVLPAIAVILTTILFSTVSTILQKRVYKEMMVYTAKENGLAIGLINGVQKLRLSGAEKRAFSRWSETYSKSAARAYNPPMFLKINSALNLFPPLMGNILLYYYAVKTNVTPADYYAFTAAYGLVTAAFNSLTSLLLSFAKIGPTYEMAEPIMKTVPETSEGKEIVRKLTGHIELNNVSFRYAENLPYVINRLNLKISPGEYVAVVGKTGCGKTTLIRLLLGLETPDMGSVYYDHKDIKKLDLSSLRNKIGTVTQDGKLFTGDIYSNIVIAQPDLDMKAAWDAAELAGIADDIREMPMGMNTVIGEGQGGISGGQRQRLMIAAAVAPKPKVLIFDEATSALDNKTQKQIADALDGLKCTRIVIAHRLSTIKNCDRIIVLDEGKIVEDGTYDELMDRDGFFADLVERQRLDI